MRGRISFRCSKQKEIDQIIAPLLNNVAYTICLIEYDIDKWVDDPNDESDSHLIYSF